jgi:hypothetical protein
MAKSLREWRLSNFQELKGPIDLCAASLDKTSI